MPTNRDPSPAEIAAACAEIRQGWSADEHFRRLRADLRPTFIRADGERETMSCEGYERHHGRRETLQDGTPTFGSSETFESGQCSKPR